MVREMEYEMWSALDRAVDVAVTVAPFLKGDKRCNKTEVTLEISKFPNWCGLTSEIVTKLINKSNRTNMTLCATHGVKFDNSDQSWQYKKIVVNYTMARTRFVTLFGVIPSGGSPPARATYSDASTETEPVPAPAHPSPHSLAQSKEAQKTRHFTSTAKNHKKSNWFQFPSASKDGLSWDWLSRVFAVAFLANILTTAAGSLLTGVSILVQQLRKVNEQGFMAGLKACKIQPFKRLSALDSLGVMSGSGISMRKLLWIGRVLKFFNNNAPVFATLKAMKALRCAEVKPRVRGTYSTPSTDGKRPTKNNYWASCPWDVLIATLQNVRDTHVRTESSNLLGVRQGKHHDVVPVVLQGDYGGSLGMGEMKFLLVMKLREGTENTYDRQIASVQGKESHSMLKQTVMATINSGIKKMNENKLLVVYWGNDFDFVAVPTHLPAGPVPLVHADGRLSAVWGPAPEQRAMFDRKDIPNIPDHKQKRLRLLPFSGGDLAYQFCLLGREFHSTSKCMCCDLMQSDWLGHRNDTGAPIDLAVAQADYDTVSQIYKSCPFLQTIYQNEEAFVKAHVKRNGTPGIDALNVLLTEIPLERFLVPPLHIMLGIGNMIVALIDEFIEVNLEKPGADPSDTLYTLVYSTLEKEFNIVRQRWFTQTLVGSDITRMLHKHNQICTRITALLKTPALRKADAHADVEERIDDFMKNIRSIMEIFEAVYMLMSKTEQLTPEELNDFDTLAGNFGLIWRRFFPSSRVTPKMHLLETHAHVQMREFGCIGDKIEAAVERLHHTVNVEHRLFAAIPDWQHRQAAMMVRRELVQQPRVEAAASTPILSSKRKYSVVTAQRKAHEEVESNAAKRLKVTNAVALTADIVMLEHHL